MLEMIYNITMVVMIKRVSMISAGASGCYCLSPQLQHCIGPFMIHITDTHRIRTCIPCKWQHSGPPDGSGRQFNTANVTAIVMSLSKSLCFPADWKLKIRTGSRFLGKTWCLQLSRLTFSKWQKLKKSRLNWNASTVIPKDYPAKFKMSTLVCTVWHVKKFGTLTHLWCPGKTKYIMIKNDLIN